VYLLKLLTVPAASGQILSENPIEALAGLIEGSV
jgi:hypothetical protein